MSIQFQSTIWTQIRKAKDGDQNALNSFVLRYQEPIKKFLLSKGVSSPDADDISQDVFTTILENRVLERAEKKKGRLRTLLLAVTQNVLKNFKKKKGSDFQSIDEIITDEMFATGETSDEFDNLWVKNIIKIALEKLKDEGEKLKIPYCETIKLYMQRDLDYESIAKQLPLTLQQVKTYIHRGKSRLVTYIKEEIESYSSSKEEYEDELNFISKYLK